MDQSGELADIDGWALTGAGRVENKRRLSVELDQTGARSEVIAAHEVFIALNSGFLAAVTNWQIRPDRADALAANDHADWRWDQRVLDDLRGLQRGLRPVCEQLAAALQRFTGTPKGTQRPSSGWIAATKPGSPNPRSTHATRFGWNSTRISWPLLAWSAAPNLGF